jgi:hypothetical protein
VAAFDKRMNRQFPCLGLAALMLVGCGAPTPPKGRPDLLDFLVDGQTRKPQVIARLGPPSGTFDRGRCLTYRVGYESENQGYHIVNREAGDSGWPTWLKAKYSLVLVFDNSGRLQRHNLLEVN